MNPLFRWRRMTQIAASAALGPRPAEYPALPLLQALYFYDPKDAAPHTAFPNQVFWYVFRDVAGWQSMGMMACNNAARIDDMTITTFPAVPASLTGPALHEYPKIPRRLSSSIAYLESLLSLTPYQSARDINALSICNFEKP